MTNIIVACETDENQKITDVAIARDVHKQLGMPLLSTISQQLHQILDIGLRVCSMNVSDQLRSEISSSYEKKYSEKLKRKDEQHISEMKKLHTELDNWKTKFSCMQSTVQEQCKSIVQDQTRQFQQTTSLLQSNVQQSIDDMKTKMIQFHSKTASTKNVGDKGENQIMNYISEHYPNWTIEDTHGAAYQGDFHTHIDDNTWILNEVKSHKGSIRTEQIRKFYRDIDKNNPNAAIMFSLYSNIVGKTNGHYELRNKTHVFFISQCDMGMNSIQVVHSILLVLLSTQMEEVSSISTQNSLVHQQKERERQLFSEQCIHKMRAQTQHLIGIYTKNIQRDKQKIEELKKELVSLTAFEQTQYQNEDGSSSTKYPWKCNLCDLLIKTHSQLFKHITSPAHCQRCPLT